jgi:hypothetical protein
LKKTGPTPGDPHLRKTFTGRQVKVQTTIVYRRFDFMVNRTIKEEKSLKVLFNSFLFRWIARISLLRTTI